MLTNELGVMTVIFVDRVCSLLRNLRSSDIPEVLKSVLNRLTHFLVHGARIHYGKRGVLITLIVGRVEQ